MLKQHGPVKRIYEEIQTIELNEFRWQEQVRHRDSGLEWFNQYRLSLVLGIGKIVMINCWFI